MYTLASIHFHLSCHTAEHRRPRTAQARPQETWLESAYSRGGAPSTLKAVFGLFARGHAEQPKTSIRRSKVCIAVQMPPRSLSHVVPPMIAGGGDGLGWVRTLWSVLRSHAALVLQK